MTTVMSLNVLATPIGPRASSLDSGFDDASDFDQLKELSDKLQLTTRRPSVVQWKQIIENRKSRGLYPTTDQTLYQNGMSTGGLQRAKSYKTAKETFTGANSNMTSNDLHRTLFRDNQDTPTNRLTSQSPLSMSGATPTPTRRCRRIARTILELDEDDVTNNNESHQDTDDKLHAAADVTKGDGDIASRCGSVSQMLEQLRHDLMIMRIEDNKLARKLLDVRGELTIVRAQHSCQEHAEMLDDVTYEMEEEEELTGLIKACDLSDKKPETILTAFSPLRHMGVSRMNLNRRRFSIR